MNISWLTLRDLEYLVAVADQKHFGKAAAACFVSQPALSSQIKKIESILNLQIFERTNRKVDITLDGELIVKQSRIVLDEARKLGEIAEKDKKPLTQMLRLGAIASLGPYYIPYFLSPIKKQFPDLKLILKEGLTDGLLAELKAGTLDVVLASPTFDDDSLKVIPLFFEPFILTVPKNHALATQKSVCETDLIANEMILLEDGHCLKDQALKLCSPNRREYTDRFHATSIETLRHLVAVGLGYTLVPFLAAKEDSRLKGLLRYRRFSGKPVGRIVALVCRKRSSRMDDIDQLVKFLKHDIPPGTEPAKE